jgi:hypothetical protein
MGRPAGPEPFTDMRLLELVGCSFFEGGSSKVGRGIDGELNVVFSRSFAFVELSDLSSQVSGL